MEQTIRTHKRTVAAGQLSAQREYWLRRLEGDWEKTALPYDREPGMRSRRRRRVGLELDRQLTEKLLALANGSDQRLFIIFLSGYLILLSRYTGREDLVVGAPTLKQADEAEFVNTVLLLRCRVAGASPFKELLTSARSTVAEATRQQNYPVETLPEQLGRGGDGGEGFPLMDTAILLEPIHDAAYIRHLDPAVLVVCRRTGEGAVIEFDFDDGCYAEPGMSLVAGRMASVLEQALRDILRPVAAIQLASAEERRLVLEEFNSPINTSPPELTVQGMALERGLAMPDQAASAFPAEGNLVLTYGELTKRSLALAAELKRLGAREGGIVPIRVPRSFQLAVAMLGTLAAGCAYLPLDVSWPEERIAGILEDCAAGFIVERGDGGCSVSLTGGRANAASGATGLLYVVYTSGSTGRPKGGMVEQAGFVNLIQTHRRLFGDDETMRSSQVASPGFDAMAFEVWPCLAAGGALVWADDDTRVDASFMKQWLITHCVTVSYQPTVLARQLAALDWGNGGAIALRALRAAGDRLTAFPPKPLPFAFYNLYGPTETTVWSTWMEVENVGGDEVPAIGRPVDNHRIYILDRYMNLQPPGVPGELCVGGVGVGRGYLNRPELTDAAFGACPHDDRVYHSGDLARWRPDGVIDFLGRIDNQVKIRGFRIELGEIERQLELFPAIRNAAVVARRDRQGNQSLCACVEAAEDLAAAEVREFLSLRLPDYMVPPLVARMEALPLLSSGKIDRRRLEAMSRSLKMEAEYAAPRNDIERRMADVWRQLLDLERVGIDDNFFTIGGDSIKTVRLLHLMGEEFSVRLKTVDLYRQETIRKLAPLVEVALRDAGGDGDMRLRRALERLDAAEDEFFSDF